MYTRWHNDILAAESVAVSHAAGRDEAPDHEVDHVHGVVVQAVRVLGLRTCKGGKC